MFKLSNPPYGESPNLARWLYQQLSELTPEDWHEVGAAGEPAFNPAWVNHGGGEATAAFRKDPFGMVHIKGTIKLGTVGTAAFTLPSGYLPEQDYRFSTTANNLFGSFSISTAGLVVPQVGANTLFSINCSFRAA